VKTHHVMPVCVITVTKEDMTTSFEVWPVKQS